MTALKSLRKRLGYQKWYWLQGGREKTRYPREVDGLQKRYARELHRLPPMTVPPSSDTQIHLLCGHKHATMAVWGLWSLLRWTDGRFAAVFHSDGSLTPGDVAMLQRFFPGVRVAEKAAMGEAVERELAGPEFDHVRRFRASHVFGPKLVDPHVGGAARTVVLLDTDVLFFTRPDELLGRCEATPEDGKLTSYRDVRESYVAPADALADRLGVRPAERLNAGAVVMPRLGPADFRTIDGMLAKFDPAWLKSHFAEQTLYALVAGLRGWHPLSDGYQIPPGNSSVLVSMHYVSQARREFFTYGVPRLLEEASRM